MSDVALYIDLRGGMIRSVSCDLTIVRYISLVTVLHIHLDSSFHLARVTAYSWHSGED